MNIFDRNTYPKPFIKLKPSRTVPGEIGAFAMRDFKAGEIIVPGELFEDNNMMSVEEYNQLEPDLKELVKAHSTITIDKVFLPANINLIRPINYFNHSCDPNTGFDMHDNYVAIKDIPKGTEFLLDYSFLNTNPDYEMQCSCGSPHCRKVITGREWRNKEFVEKFEQYFCSTVREML